MHFSPKNWEPTEKNMAPHESRDPEKPCVEFEERLLNTLRENRMCQKIYQSDNQEHVARLLPTARLDITY